MILFSGLAAASLLLVALGARAGQPIAAEVARAICVSFSSRGVGAGLSGARASYLGSRGERWRAAPRPPAPEEQGDDAGLKYGEGRGRARSGRAGRRRQRPS